MFNVAGSTRNLKERRQKKSGTCRAEDVLVALEPRLRYLPIIVGQNVVSVNIHGNTVFMQTINEIEAF